MRHSQRAGPVSCFKEAQQRAANEHRLKTRSQSGDEAHRRPRREHRRIEPAHRHLVGQHSKEQRTEALGFSVKTDPPKDNTTPTTEAPLSRSRDPSRSCTHCGRKGHDITECFLVRGYLEWFHEQQLQNGSSGNRGGRGGRSNNNGGRGRGRASHASTSINNEQIASLITLLQNQQSNISSEASHSHDGRYISSS